MELRFEKIDRELQQDSNPELRILSAFLDNYAEIRINHLPELELTTSELVRIDKIAEHYSRQKITEPNILKTIYLFKTLKIYGVNNPEKIVEFLLRSEYRDCTILLPEHLHKLEKIKFFNELQTKFSINFLIFDSETLKIVGIDAIAEQIS